MGVANLQEILQQKMNNVSKIFEFIRAYIYIILILTRGDRTDHVHKLEFTRNKLKEIVLIYSIEQYLFGQKKMEYLVLWVTNDGVKHIDKK